MQTAADVLRYFLSGGACSGRPSRAMSQYDSKTQCFCCTFLRNISFYYGFCSFFTTRVTPNLPYQTLQGEPAHFSLQAAGEPLTIPTSETMETSQEQQPSSIGGPSSRKRQKARVIERNWVFGSPYCKPQEKRDAAIFYIRIRIKTTSTHIKSLRHTPHSYPL